MKYAAHFRPSWLAKKGLAYVAVGVEPWTCMVGFRVTFGFNATEHDGWFRPLGHRRYVHVAAHLPFVAVHLHFARPSVASRVAESAARPS